MAFRSTIGQWKTLLKSKVMAYLIATIPNMKAYASIADYSYVHHHYQHGKLSKTSAKGDFVPVYMAIRMIALLKRLNLHIAWQQLRTSSTMHVKKQRRETMLEVVELEYVAKEADRFIKKSLLRKVAHVLDFNNLEKQVIPDPIHKDVYVENEDEALKS